MRFKTVRLTTIHNGSKQTIFVSGGLGLSSSLMGLNYSYNLRMVHSYEELFLFFIINIYILSFFKRKKGTILHKREGLLNFPIILSQNFPDFPAKLTC